MTGPSRQPPRPAQPKKDEPKSLLRNLGEFVGHIAHGIKSNPNGPTSAGQTGASEAGVQPPEPTIVRQEVLEQEVMTPEGKLVLRRTIIDEVERAPGVDNQPPEAGRP